jgi:phosphoglucosamine mutase
MQQLLSNIMASVKPRNFSPCDVDGVDGSAKQLYVNHLLRSVDVDFAGLPICVDCAFGGGFDVAKEVFGGKNANVICVNDTPNGESINVNCGATHPHVLAQHCQKNGIKLGFCLDGDADRLVVVEDGKVVEGSRLIFAIAKYLNEQGRLANKVVVGTVVTNGGLKVALKQIGCNLLRSQVGDTKVFQLMKQAGASLGGEGSGHVIFGDQQTGSDALLTALVAGKICVEKGSILHYSSDYVPLPTAKSSIRGVANVNLEAVSQRIEKLFPSCRIVLRKSGTEAVVRAYVEGQECNQALVEIEKSLKS